MCRRVYYLVVFILACTVMLYSGAQAQLKVDFDGTDSGNNAGPTQEGFESIRSGSGTDSNASVDVSVTYPDAFGPGKDATVRINANRWKLRANITSGDETAVALADLLRDFAAPKGLDTATLYLTLPAGLYSITVYHHESNRSHVEDATLTLTDIDGPRDPVLLISGYGDDPATAPLAYEATIRSDGTNTITFVYFNDGPNAGAFPINGFVLDSMMGAHDPQPANKPPVFQELDVTLDWAVGLDPNNLDQPNPAITAHYIYIGSGEPSDPNLYYADQIPADGQARASYGPLNLGTDGTYLWRVDESVNDSSPGDPNTIKGKVWTFETIKSTPVIVTQPQTTVVAPNGTAQISVEVESLSQEHYQWFKVGNPDTPVGGDSPDLIIENATVETDEGHYYCTVTNDSGVPVDTDIVGLGIKRQVVYLPLDGDYIDDSGEGNDAQATDPNTAVFVEGKVGQAVDMDAAGTAQIGIFNPSEFTDRVSISLWINSKGHPDNLGLISKRTANNADEMMWTLQLRGANTSTAGSTVRQVRFYTSGGFDVYSGAGNEVIPGEWTHVCVTADGTTAAVYLNGMLVATGQGPMGMGADVPLYIGMQELQNRIFEGQVDEVRIFNYDVTAEEVAQLYFDVTGIGSCVYPSDADIDGDCVVDLVDLAAVAGEWLHCGLRPLSTCQ
ncbi:MAG: immunoglobulin domain-containing protein [Planctomycetes bacterium]|nr:immunoglobulin domain-containing protein [Planctomycetota bacterium]